MNNRIQRKDKPRQALHENEVSDLKSLEERLEVTKANMKGLEKNPAELESGPLKERRGRGKIGEDAKELETEKI